jgi:hypothetical protein
MTVNKIPHHLPNCPQAVELVEHGDSVNAFVYILRFCPFLQAIFLPIVYSNETLMGIAR